MKSLIIAIALTLSGAETANAALYGTTCDSCTPFGINSSSVLNAAITVAQQNSAQVGDNVFVCKDRSAHTSTVINYDVNSSPVTSSSNLTADPPYDVGSDTNCAGN